MCIRGNNNRWVCLKNLTTYMIRRIQLYTYYYVRSVYVYMGVETFVELVLSKNTFWTGTILVLKLRWCW